MLPPLGSEPRTSRSTIEDYASIFRSIDPGERLANGCWCVGYAPAAGRAGRAGAASVKRTAPTPRNNLSRPLGFSPLTVSTTAWLVLCGSPQGEVTMKRAMLLAVAAASALSL